MGGNDKLIVRVLATGNVDHETAAFEKTQDARARLFAFIVKADLKIVCFEGRCEKH